MQKPERLRTGGAKAQAIMQVQPPSGGMCATGAMSIQERLRAYNRAEAYRVRCGMYTTADLPKV
jgi:hypothetical protein